MPTTPTPSFQSKPEIPVTGLAATAVAEPESRRSSVILQLTAGDGLTGVGEAPASPDPAAAVAEFGRLRPSIVGQDARSFIPIDQALLRTGASAGSRAAVNIALHDILGKLTKAPLYEVLGGPTRDKARAMAVVSGDSREQLRDAVLEAKAAGFRAFSVPLQMPETSARGRAFYRETRALLDSLRAAAGDDSDFVLDCAGQTTPAEGLSLAAAFEDFHLLWLDEPGSDLSAAALSAASDNSVTPIGYGRHFTGNQRFQDLLGNDGIDVLRPDIRLAGVTETRKAAALAEVYYIALSSYNRGGPIATAAALHTGVALPNYFIQEVPFGSSADRTMRDELAGVAIEKPDDGFYLLPPGPGLGIQLNEDALEKYRLEV